MLASGQVLWPYRDSKTGQYKSIPLEPTEFIRRFLQHVLPKGFCRVRLFGWLHPAGKIRGNRVRALLEQAPILTSEERQTWQQMSDLVDDAVAARRGPEVPEVERSTSTCSTI